MLVFELKRSFARAYVGLSHDQIMIMLTLAFLMATAAAFATLRLRPWVGLTAQAVGYLVGLGIGYKAGTSPAPVFALCLGMVCFISLGAGFTARRGMVGAWLTALSLAANFALCLVALGIVFAGGILIAEAIKTLLGVDVKNVFEFFIIIACWFGVPFFWLSLSRFCEDDPDSVHPVNLLYRVISVVTDGLLIPLMLIFAGVIHLYAVRIGILLELPKGQIGWIVPTYLAIGYGVYLLSHTPGTLLPSLRRMFLSAWLFATLVPLVLLGIAAGMRINAYGITEERYILAFIVLGFALVAASALVRRPLDLRALPLIGGTLALVSAIGPLSAHNVTIYSQLARVHAIITSVPPERWAQSPDGGLSDQQRKDLVSSMGELEKREVVFEQVIPPDAWPKGFPRDSWKLARELDTNITSEAYTHSHVSFAGGQVTRLGPVILIDGSYIDWESKTPQTRKSNDLSYTLQVRGNILEVSGENSTTRFDLSTLLTQKDVPDGNGPRPVFQSIEGRKGEMIVEEFSRRHHATGSELVPISAKIALY
jgi:hypothetical protein